MARRIKNAQENTSEEEKYIPEVKIKSKKVCPLRNNKIIHL